MQMPETVFDRHVSSHRMSRNGVLVVLTRRVTCLPMIRLVGCMAVVAVVMMPMAARRNGMQVSHRWRRDRSHQHKC